MKNTRAKGRTISIALVVSLALAAVVTLVLVAFAILFYRGEREQQWGQLHKAVAISADELAVAVALPAWNFDESQILAIMRSGLNNQEMVASVVAPTSSRHQYVLAREGADLVASETVPDTAGLLSERRAIMVAGQNIGSVTMYATTALLKEQLHQRQFTLVGIILVLDITLVASLYLLLWLLILRPLKAVGDYAASVKAGETMTAAPQRAWFFGELKRLNESIREMIGLLDRRYQAMHRSEERLQMATSAASIGIWDWDLVNNELNWDEQMLRLFDADKASTVPRLDIWFAALIEEDREPAAQAMAAARRGEGEFDIEFRIVGPGGGIHHIKADAITFRDDAGRPVRMVGTVYDITDHKEAELELRRHRNHLEELVEERTKALSVAVTQAQAANRAKSVFLANMSHELRTPLNSVIGFSRLMAGSTNMLPEEKRNLAIIHRSGNHLLTLINDILELSKIEAGRVVAQTEVIGVSDLLQEVMDMVSMRAGQSGIALRLDCAGTPPTARIDGTKLRQVLLNLLSNAVKFALQGEVTLRVRGEPQDAGPGGTGQGGDAWRLSFAVIDNGIGIAAMDQERIFEPFIQAEGEGAKEGTGLGLTISREFVHLLGGQLTLQSAPGHGSVFSFSIPVMAAGLLPVALGGEVAALVPEQRGKRILVVDDNADGCELLVNLLTPLGFLVEAVSDGASALAAIARWQPELILMDWRMPGLDGLEVTRLVRSRPGLVQPRIVMLTASAFEEEKQAALAAGADEFLRKPVEQEMLYLALEQQLGLHFMRRQPAPVPPLRSPLSRADVVKLTPQLRGALKAAVQELNLTRVAALLAPLPAELDEVVERIEHMLSLHQYPPLCALLEMDDTEHGVRAGARSG